MKFTLPASALALLLSVNTLCAAAPRVATAMVDGVSYKAILNGDNSLSIKNGTKTVLYIKRADLYVTFEKFQQLNFADFNGDGYADLIIEYKSTVPGRCDLVIYNKGSKKFELVQQFTDYPEAHHIANTPFYYSYHVSGCAGLDWDSDLFKITDAKVVRTGNIAGKGCQNSGEKLGLFVHSIKGKSEHLLEELSLNAVSPYKFARYGFIAHYWMVNYGKFKR